MRPSFSMAVMSSCWTSPSLPTSHSTGSFSSAVLAFHQVSAMTATVVPSTETTFFTPGIFSTLAASKLLSLPPMTGQCLTAAFSMPGSLTSMP